MDISIAPKSENGQR